MFEKVVVVDCAGHMMGRVASVLAKEIMNGQKVVAVRTEELCISGSLFRHKRTSLTAEEGVGGKGLQLVDCVAEVLRLCVSMACIGGVLRRSSIRHCIVYRRVCAVVCGGIGGTQ